MSSQDLDAVDVLIIAVFVALATALFEGGFLATGIAIGAFIFLMSI